MQRWLNMAKVAPRSCWPLVYKVVSNAQSSDKTAEAGGVDLKAAGINATGPAAALGARIVRLERTLDGLETSRGGERGGQGFRRLHPHAPDRPAHGRRDRRDHAPPPSGARSTPRSPANSTE
ncbi:hypothetical protein [Dietzia lutea]|uniref:hypothetical protein n=1 Tax=Dietzia lutea TaxID=546160 RepID=UPI0031342662